MQARAIGAFVSLFAGGVRGWLEDRRGTSADLDLFNARIVRAIREVDPATPVLIEGYAHGSVSLNGWNETP